MALSCCMSLQGRVRGQGGSWRGGVAEEQGWKANSWHGGMWCLVTRLQQCHQSEQWDKNRAVFPVPEMNCSILWSYWVSFSIQALVSFLCLHPYPNNHPPLSPSPIIHRGAESGEALSPQDGTKPSAADGALIIPLCSTTSTRADMNKHCSTCAW